MLRDTISNKFLAQRPMTTWSPGKPDVSVIVVSWNTREHLATCLESIERGLAGARSVASPSWTCEVIVIDNRSSDGTPAFIRSVYPWVRFINNETNVGYARANNRALLLAKGRYILLLNPDTVVSSGALESLVRFMDDHQDAGAAGPLLVNPDNTLQQSCHPLPTLPREAWRLMHLDALMPFGIYRMDSWRRDLARRVDVLQGAALILRRETLGQVGLFDERFFMYSEEVDLCRRILQGGWKIYWVPQATIVHFGGQSTLQVADAMFVQLYRAKTDYFRKYHGPAGSWIYKFILFVASAVRLLLAPLGWLLQPRRRSPHLLLARRYLRLLTTLPSL